MKKFSLAIITCLTTLILVAQVGNELYRPTFHFSPKQNWMNDPNGLVYYNGKYHMFFQSNPYGLDPAGNKSWGHAVSLDLINWEEKPIAIPAQNGVMAYSGSVVVDWKNTSGFGINGQPPLVAIYTGATNVQDQRIAYSNDEGLTWTNYSGNPVISNNNNEFRDPKVIWHEPTQKWIMVVSHGAWKGIAFYSSPNLKNWTSSQFFEPVGNTSTYWECPDFFNLPVDNDTNHKKWILVHSIEPTAQYFIGDFDGTHFTWETTPPNGILIDDFESSNYNKWTSTGTAFGTSPASGTTTNTGYLGNKLVYSFAGGPAQGKLVSSNFTIQKNYISFLIGGGYHPNGAYIKLVVQGQTVKTSTGMNEDLLKWRSWDVSSLMGQTARIEIVDSIFYGNLDHINIDHIIQSDAPIDNTNNGQVDYGRDFYALQSFSDIPVQDGRRIWLAWLNSWVYAVNVPTSPWKGIMSIPREVKLETHNGQIKLIQKPVKELNILHKDTLSYRNTNLSVINSAIKNSVYKRFELKAKIATANKKGFSLKFKKNASQFSEFIFKFDSKEILFNRANSGALTNDGNFVSLQVAPLIVENGYFDLQLFVDNSSAELFSAGGQIVMSNQIFPDSTSNQTELTSLDQDMLFEEFDIWNFDKTRAIPPDLPPPPPPPSSPSSNGQNTFYFRAYPNPVLGNNDLTIKINDYDVGKVKIKIFNASGMLIHEFRPASTSVNIPISKLTKSSGMFYLRGLRGQATYTERIIVLVDK
ncbi:MAG TPA: GH32 C-terminal domain-containing protein [Chitinophagaceae bacterium]|nr:GH32 C-terminal domain-containing protein [Chitinophagaceae bacterium]